MSAQHAVLGLLLDRPAYAYELANRLQERLGPTWAINSGQLSQTLQKLESEGLIQKLEGYSTGRRGRRIFGVTDDGAAEFDRWWFEEQPNTVAPPRRPLLVKLTLAGPMRLKESLRQIEAYELECAQRLNEATKRRDEVSDGPQLRTDHVLLRLGLRGDMFQLEGELAWARHAREVVSWLLSRDAVWPTGRDSSDGQDARERLFGRMAARRGPAEEE
jgi:DNA-binding PadR family transcriptional regulator